MSFLISFILKTSSVCKGKLVTFYQVFFYTVNYFSDFLQHESFSFFFHTFFIMSVILFRYFLWCYFYIRHLSRRIYGPFSWGQCTRCRNDIWTCTWSIFSCFFNDNSQRNGTLIKQLLECEVFLDFILSNFFMKTVFHFYLF